MNKLEILFKAKRIDNGEWVEGYVFDNDETRPEMRKFFVGSLSISKYQGTACDDWSIDGSNFYEVDPETICRYTGLTDSDGNKVFENDILEFTERPDPRTWLGMLEFGDAYDASMWGWQLVWVGRDPNPAISYYFNMKEEIARSKVVGNIHDKEAGK